MNKIRVGSKTKIVLDVNDKGETISFDFADPSFLENAQTMILKAEALQKDFADVGAFLENLETDEMVDDMLLSDDMLNLGKSMTEYFAGLRGAIDNFLGKNASQKIFGDDNYLQMFDDLFDQLQPYLDEAAKLQHVVIKSAKERALNRVPQNNKKRTL